LESEETNKYMKTKRVRQTRMMAPGRKGIGKGSVNLESFATIISYTPPFRDRKHNHHVPPFPKARRSSGKKKKLSATTEVLVGELLLLEVTTSVLTVVRSANV